MCLSREKLLGSRQVCIVIGKPSTNPQVKSGEEIGDDFGGDIYGSRPFRVPNREDLRFLWVADRPGTAQQLA
jgi:hypothetical protein